MFSMGEIIMASAAGSNASRSRTNSTKSTSRSTSGNSKKTSSGTRKRTTAKKNTRKSVDIAVKNEVMLIVIFALSIFTFLCVTGLIHGTAATGISDIMFGIFGLLAYLIPVIIFVGFAFGISNKGNTVAIVKMVSSVVLIFLAGIISYMLMKQNSMITGTSFVKELYQTSAEHHAGGGVLFGSVAYGMYKLMGFVGTLFVVIVTAIICIVFITEKSFITGVKKGSSYLFETAREDAARMREYRESLRESYDDEYDEYDDEDEYIEERPGRRRKNQKSQAEDIKNNVKEEKVRRMDKKARGVASISSMTLKPEKEKVDLRQDIHEITLLDNEKEQYEDISLRPYNEVIYDKPSENDFAEADFASGDYEEDNLPEDIFENEAFEEEITSQEFFVEDSKGTSVQKSFLDEFTVDDEALNSMPEPVTEDTFVKEEPVSYKFTKEDIQEIKKEEAQIEEHVANMEEQTPKKYVFPPLSLLKKGEGRKGDSSNQLKETALRLQQTLQTFGVRVTITDISQGPSVTRYEMQPEQGVKVSKIVGLADDIKLNLAATDIRIEAPIPGKAAVGIEVPNKENSTVALRDLLESDEFQNFKSNIAFAVGKDIAGQVVVTDIAKMPHVLIAGATGSGKSVCINTIIMSILYKADPSDVKLIMIDPKVVELSVYNGIPHLMIPVVTDPKKASAALNWGVSEMNDRYRKFAELNVRDLKGYNKAAEMGKLTPDGEPLQKLPQIVIIVDELADLMMVASGEVEESICRLAQLARACGIHLVIATQRPSVDVITGLIKANMPSRIAFSVSSGVDSRTILDMNGAEKLLGKGDMLFYPQGYPKPARVQGAFVSDSEVSDVVDFLKNQMLGNNTYNSEIEDKIKTLQTSSGSSGGLGGGGNEVDTYFVDAGKFVIDKDKASIGMLQRVFKIGFNRAARIVDQLEEAGVIGAEEGTKPRRILMSMEQFENYIEENL
jgi:S-DNA-T family DNA segregation ATPase FtsK/SpoIIIE